MKRVKEIISGSVIIIVLLVLVGWGVYSKLHPTPEFSDVVSLEEANARLAIFGQSYLATKEDFELHFLALRRVSRCVKRCDINVPDQQPDIGKCHRRRVEWNIPESPYKVISSLWCSEGDSKPVQYQAEMQVCVLESDGGFRQCLGRDGLLYQRTDDIAPWVAPPDPGHAGASFIRQGALAYAKAALINKKK